MIRTLFITLALFAAVIAGSASAEEIVAKGTFSGLSNHDTSGSITILKTDDGYVAVLGEDFSLDGAPAPTLGFGKAGTFDKATEFTKLGANNGKQTYAIPASIDISAFDEFYVWCADVSIPLGVAKLS